MRRPFGDPADQEVPTILWQQSSHPGVSTAPSLLLGHSVHTWLHTCICHPLSQERHALLPPHPFFNPSKARVLQVRRVEPVLHTACLNPLWSLRATVYIHTQDGGIGKPVEETNPVCMTVALTLLKTEEAIGLTCVAIISGDVSEGQDHALPFAYSFHQTQHC